MEYTFEVIVPIKTIVLSSEVVKVKAKTKGEAFYKVNKMNPRSSERDYSRALKVGNKYIQTEMNFEGLDV